MTFHVRDLMLDVLPEMCAPDTGRPAPAPCQPPSCAKNSAKAEEDEEESVPLAALAALREQLREALRS
jgi:hypothetical protein